MPYAEKASCCSVDRPAMVQAVHTLQNADAGSKGILHLSLLGGTE